MILNRKIHENFGWAKKPWKWAKKVWNWRRMYFGVFWQELSQFLANQDSYWDKTPAVELAWLRFFIYFVIYVFLSFWKTELTISLKPLPPLLVTTIYWWWNTCKYHFRAGIGLSRSGRHWFSLNSLKYWFWKSCYNGRFVF